MIHMDNNVNINADTVINEDTQMMGNTAEQIHAIALEAVNESELRSNEIPAIDLYVDQIINLVSEKLSHGSDRYKERLLTKTMINNYSKDGLITPVKGKKYSKEQIIQMLTVYTLKSTFSIGEIKRLLDGAYASDGFDGEALTSLYDRHMEIKEATRAVAADAVGKVIDINSLDVADDRDFITAVCATAALSAQLKNIAQAMLDARFPAPEIPEDEDAEPERSKKERKEEKKEKKKEKKEEKKEAKEEKREAKEEKKEAKREEKKAKSEEQ